MLRIQQLKLPITYTEADLLQKAAKTLRVPRSDILGLSIRRRSLDARKKPELFYILTVDVRVEQELAVLKRCRDKNVSAANEVSYRIPSPAGVPGQRPVIIGTGPAGLFCGLLLARAGWRPILLERGQDVDSRTKTVEAFWNGAALDPSSNVQFGEGGAGTFSDGKLNTMVKDKNGRNRFVLETFVGAGADPEILWAHRPHIGTDVLKTVVKNIRRKIEDCGGEVRFQSCVTDILHRDGHVTGVQINGGEIICCGTVVAAIGHSARDTFAMLAQKPLLITPKSFAVGLRVEHPQEMINVSQYGEGYPKTLPAADYKLTATLPNGRGVYSFCMCPGGYVVNASSEKNALALNGMSYHARDGRNANSALVVTVTPADFGGTDVLAGIRFQQRLEQFAYRAGGGKVPIQLLGDFERNVASVSLGDVQPCIRGGFAFANLREGLPRFLGDSLAEGVRLFEQRIRGFSRPDAVFSGVESRTSSPVRIARNGDFNAVGLAGLYPCGEGAGYAGGITSAAMDGMKCAEAILQTEMV